MPRAPCREVAAARAAEWMAVSVALGYTAKGGGAEGGGAEGGGGDGGGLRVPGAPVRRTASIPSNASAMSVTSSGVFV
eukprot:685906-Prymnesium_polylepis.1